MAGDVKGEIRGELSADDDPRARADAPGGTMALRLENMSAAWLLTRRRAAMEMCDNAADCVPGAGTLGPTTGDGVSCGRDSNAIALRRRSRLDASDEERLRVPLIGAKTSCDGFMPSSGALNGEGA